MSAEAEPGCNIRTEIKQHCSPKTLAEYDAVISKLREECRAAKKINLLWSFNLSLALWLMTLIFGIWAGYSRK